MLFLVEVRSIRLTSYIYNRERSFKLKNQSISYCDWYGCHANQKHWSIRAIMENSIL